MPSGHNKLLPPPAAKYRLGLRRWSLTQCVKSKETREDMRESSQPDNAVHATSIGTQPGNTVFANRIGREQKIQYLPHPLAGKPKIKYLPLILAGNPKIQCLPFLLAQNLKVQYMPHPSALTKHNLLPSVLIELSLQHLLQLFLHLLLIIPLQMMQLQMVQERHREKN